MNSQSTEILLTFCYGSQLDQITEDYILASFENQVGSAGKKVGYFLGITLAYQTKVVAPFQLC
jgi:hypothetical protein